MNPSAFFNAIGSSSLFSTRVFLPALLSALLLRFGPDVPVIQHLGLLAHVAHNQPAWFTSNPCLIALTILSVLEILAQKNSEARKLIQEFDIYLKPALAALTTLGFLSATDAGFVAHTVQRADLSDGILPLVSAVLTYRLAALRKTVAVEVFDHLEGTGADKLLSWLEEAWTVFGALLLFIFPILMLLIIGAATAVLLLLKKRLDLAEEKSRLPCNRCGMMIYPCAVACPACRQSVDQPRAVGFLGHSNESACADPALQPFRLYEKRRCPRCATRLAARKPFDPCPTCGDLSHAQPEFAQDFAAFIARRLPIVLLVCFLMSLVPILGLIVASVYYRMEIVLPFSQYLPLGKRFLLRWGIRALFLVLVILQIVPLVGGLVAPLMALISYAAYRSSYLSLMQSPPQPAAAPTPQPA